MYMTIIYYVSFVWSTHGQYDEKLIVRFIIWQCTQTKIIKPLIKYKSKMVWKHFYSRATKYNKNHNLKELHMQYLLFDRKGSILIRCWHLSRAATGLLNSRNIIHASNINRLSLGQSCRIIPNVEHLPADDMINLG